jgi:hypothetical protein
MLQFIREIRMPTADTLHSYVFFENKLPSRAVLRNILSPLMRRAARKLAWTE